jgi:hypothetical protein
MVSQNSHHRPSHHGGPCHAKSGHQRISKEQVPTAVASTSQTVTYDIVHDALLRQLRGQSYFRAAQTHYPICGCWLLCQSALLIIPTPVVHARWSQTLAKWEESQIMYPKENMENARRKGKKNSDKFGMIHEDS